MKVSSLKKNQLIFVNELVFYSVIKPKIAFYLIEIGLLA